MVGSNPNKLYTYKQREDLFFLKQNEKKREYVVLLSFVWKKKRREKNKVIKSISF